MTTAFQTYTSLRSDCVCVWYQQQQADVGFCNHATSEKLVGWTIHGWGFISKCKCEHQHGWSTFLQHRTPGNPFLGSPVSMDKLYASMSHLREHYCSIDITKKIDISSNIIPSFLNNLSICIVYSKLESIQISNLFKSLKLHLILGLTQYWETMEVIIWYVIRT